MKIKNGAIWLSLTSFITCIAILAQEKLAAEIGTGLQMQLGNPTNATDNSANNANYLLDVRAASAVDFSNN